MLPVAKTTLSLSLSFVKTSWAPYWMVGAHRLRLNTWSKRARGMQEGYQTLTYSGLYLPSNLLTFQISEAGKACTEHWLKWNVSILVKCCCLPGNGWHAKAFWSFDFRESPCLLWRVWSLPVLGAMMPVEGDGTEEGSSLPPGLLSLAPYFSPVPTPGPHTGCWFFTKQCLPHLHKAGFSFLFLFSHQFRNIFPQEFFYRCTMYYDHT